MGEFSIQTITALTEAVTGGSAGGGTPPVGLYRSGPELQRFFGQANLELDIGRGSRVPTVRELLTTTGKQADGHAAIIRVIELVTDPRDYLDAPEKLDAVVEYLNARLRLDGYELRRAGQRYKVFAVASNAQVTETLRATVTILNLESVQEDFERALNKAEADPPGAITAACSTLESVCKCLLDRMGKPYPLKQDISGLVKEVSKHLNLSPARTDFPKEGEQDIRQVLSGLVSVTGGIGALRTHVGDAHGRGEARPRVDARIARLAIHSACTIALFYIETWQKVTRTTNSN